jgi:23S rRNA (adenine2503-C2)-methyltransferase
LYQNLWASPWDFTTLPKKLREKLDETFLFAGLEPLSSQFSTDGETQKTLFRLPDGLALETVLMRYKRRQTLCVSTQAGCAMGCVFCATGQMGFKRNLTSGEITEQVLYFARKLAEDSERVTNIVFMGMGEPLHNYDATMNTIDRLGHPDGFNFGARRFTISTVGLVPAIRRFAAEKRQVNLAVSLHAANDELRSSLLPINNKYPISELMDACLEYLGMTNRRITIEWALINDINDSIDHAHELANLLQPFRRNNATLCHVNVIPLNPTDKYHGTATNRERALEFQQVLEDNGIPCTIRLRRGIDIQAGCGQLAYEKGPA